MTDTHTLGLEDMKKVFIRCSHINFYIIACLRAKEALNEFQVSQLSGENSLLKRSQMVFDWMENNQSFRDVVRQVMDENEQEHVSNLLQGIQNGSHVPLSPVRCNRLESIAPKLMMTINNGVELIAKLREKSAISEIDRQDITHQSVDYKRNWNLIEAIRRRSDYAFDCLEQALRETSQEHVANYLHEGQMIAVHAKTTQPEKDDVLSDLLNKVIIDETKDSYSSEDKVLTTINGYNVHPVAAKTGQSIVFFLYCKTVDNMITFTELFISGDLQSMIEVIMNRLLLKIGCKTMEHLKARLKLDNSEILDVERFSGIEDWMPVEFATSTSLISEETQTEHQQPDEDRDAVRKQYWEQERKSLYHKFQSLLAEEEELLKHFLPETAPSEQERNWTQRRNTLREEFENLLDKQNYILKSVFSKPKSEDNNARIYELRQKLSNIEIRLKQQQDRWKRLKDQLLLVESGDLKRATFQATFSTTAFNRIDLHLNGVRYLKFQLETTKGDIFCELENLKADGKILVEIKDKQPEAGTSAPTTYSAIRKQHRQRELLLLRESGQDEFELIHQFKPKMSSRLQLRSYDYKRFETPREEEQLYFMHRYKHHLADIMDLDSTLLPLLFEREVLNSREYMRISYLSTRFEKDEALMFAVARKNSEEKNEFQDALFEVLHSEDKKTKKH